MYFVVTIFLLVLIFSGFTPFSFAQSIGSADVLLTDIYIEPADPKPGDSVSIQSIIYNAGLDSTKSVTDVITVGYFVNGDLVKIDELPDILPGIENGVLISSGPIWTASDGAHTITVILNYHDTLSNLTDNPSNNIVQRIFSIGEPRPSIVLFEIFQEYIPQTKMQQITIEGNLISSDLLFLPDRIKLQIDNLHDIIPVDQNGLFSFSKSIRSFDEITKVTITVEETYPLLGSSYTANIYPIQLEKDSILSFIIQNPSEFYNFNDSSAVIAIYDESYDIIKKIDTNNLSSSEKTYNTIFTTLPSGIYIVEIYFEGRFLTAIKTDLKENGANTNNILIPETSQVKFQILDNNREPIQDATVQNWIFTLNTDENGFTDWIDILPTLGDKEPYAAKVILPNGKIFWSDSFFIDYGERKIIQMVTSP
jgi:hypothetical protein